MAGQHAQRRNQDALRLLLPHDLASALRALKRKLQREGLFRELERRRAYEKPLGAKSSKSRRVRAAAAQALRTRLVREGY
jgi:small subunit ribosomal protein S21